MWALGPLEGLQPSERDSATPAARGLREIHHLCRPRETVDPRKRREDKGVRRALPEEEEGEDTKVKDTGSKAGCVDSGMVDFPDRDERLWLKRKERRVSRTITIQE